MVKELASPQEEQAQKELFQKTLSLSNKLIEGAIQHNDVWRSSKHPIQETQKFYAGLIQSNLYTLLTGYINPETNKEYVSDTPQESYILIEEIDYSKAKVPRGFKSLTAALGLQYETQTHGVKEIRVVLDLGTKQIRNSVHSSRKGSEGEKAKKEIDDIGENWQIQKVNIDQLQTFYDILKKNTKA